jgi:hypothetical protein
MRRNVYILLRTVEPLALRREGLCHDDPGLQWGGRDNVGVMQEKAGPCIIFLRSLFTQAPGGIPGNWAFQEEEPCSCDQEKWGSIFYRWFSTRGVKDQKEADR